MDISKLSILEWEDVFKNKTIDTKNLPSDIYNNKEIMLCLLKYHHNSLQLLSDNLRNDKDIIKTALKYNNSCFKWAGKSIQNDISMNKYAVKLNLINFLFIHETFKSNFEIALLVVSGGALLWQNVGTDLKNNKDFLLQAITINSNNFFLLENSFKNDLDLIEIVLEQNGLLLSRFPLLQGNKEIVKKAMKSHPFAFKHASPTLQNDDELFLFAASKNPEILKYANERIKNNPDIVLPIIDKNVSLFKYIGKTLLQNNEFIDNFLSKNYSTIEKLENIHRISFLRTLVQNDSFNVIYQNWRSKNITQNSTINEIIKNEPQLWDILMSNKLKKEIFDEIKTSTYKKKNLKF